MGATLYCKTSVPHTIMCGETVNNIIGYTWNPKNRNLSSGGSSGGEGVTVNITNIITGLLLVASVVSSSVLARIPRSPRPSPRGTSVPPSAPVGVGTQER